MILGRRRFRVLSPTVVRLEFSPDGRFEDRPSLVAASPQSPGEFVSVGREGAWEVLGTGAMEIRVRQHDRPFDRTNLEIRWTDSHYGQFWRPGDRDYQNLGGALRSLDRYGGPAAVLDGVHAAGMESPDSVAPTWMAWNQDEVDPLHVARHPAPAGKGHATWLADAARAHSGGDYPARSFNLGREARQFPPGLLSRSGYFLLNDSLGAVFDADGFPVERATPGTQDWYFFAYGDNYLQPLADFRLLSGPGPLPPRRALGIYFSRWPAFSEAEIDELAESFRTRGHPLSTLVMDMEWHKEGWGHWEFNPALIPDPARFFARCRELGLDVVFNDHPIDVREDDRHFAEYVRRAGPNVEIREREYQGRVVRMAAVDICDREQNRAFRTVCEEHLWDLGLSYLWNDGTRGQMAGTMGQLVGSLCFFEDSRRNGRRGMHLARYGGLGSHRYGAFFTGDANSDFHVLRLQCEFNIRAAGSGLSLLSHDIGGFSVEAAEVRRNARGTEIIDPLRYLRWLQFGVFNPILRFHSAPWAASRRPEEYDDLLNGACRRWLRERHRLLPYLYTATRTFHDAGLPVTRGMFLENPHDPQAYRFDQYFFGPDLLVAPMLDEVGERAIYLPAGSKAGWWEWQTARQVPAGTFTRTVAPEEVPVYVRSGSIVPLQNPDGPLHPGHLEELHLHVYAGADGRAELYEDDGETESYRQGAFCRTAFTLQGAGRLLGLHACVAAGAPLGAERVIHITLSAAERVASVVDDQGRELPVRPTDDGRFSFILNRRPSGAPWSLAIHLA